MKLSRKLGAWGFAIVLLALAFVAIRGGVAFNGHQSYKYRDVCVSNLPGYFVSEDKKHTSSFYSINKYNFDKSAIYVGSDFDRIQYESYHYRKFLRLKDSSEEINLLATSQGELDAVEKMVKTCH